MPMIEDLPTVHQAWSAVMDEVQSIGKDSENQAQKFKFRGIDAVMDAVGPAMRKHGVFAVPLSVARDAERYTTGKYDTPMINRVVEMAYQVFGPRGDSFVGSAFGEAADAGDKSMSKAESVAYRVFLLQSLCIPTGDPDPDASTDPRNAPAPAKESAERPKSTTPQAAAIATLKTLCAKSEWPLDAINALYLTTYKVGVADGSADDLKAFTALLETGAIKVPA